LTVQKNFDGKWASDVIFGRYQIMESWLSQGKFYIYDLEDDDQIRDNGGSIMYFEDANVLQKFLEQRSARLEGKSNKSAKGVGRKRKVS
jgi:hypothetical protein